MSKINNETPKKAQTAPIEAFAKAFTTLFKCKRDEIEIDMIDPEVAFAVYKEQGYKICTWDGLRDDIEFRLSNNLGAQTINLSAWLQVTVNTLSINCFVPKLVDKLENSEQAQLLQLALSISSFSDDQYETFWKTLANIDKEGTLFGNAIISGREVLNGFGLLDDMTEMTILEGEDGNNPIKGGIFKTVHLQDKKLDIGTLYIYSAEHHFSE